MVLRNGRDLFYGVDDADVEDARAAQAEEQVAVVGVGGDARVVGEHEVDEALVEEFGEVGVAWEDEEARFLVGLVDGDNVVEEFGVPDFVLGGRGEGGEDVEAALKRHDEDLAIEMNECVYEGGDARDVAMGG